MARPKHKRPDDCHTSDQTPCCWEANATLQPSSFTGCGCALSRGWGVGQGRKPHTSPESRGDRKWVHDTLPGDRGWIGNGQIETAHKPPMLLCSGKITSLLPRLLRFNLVQSCVAYVGTVKAVRSQHGTKSPQQLVYPCCCLMKPGAPIYSIQFSSVQFSSVAQSCSTLGDPINCNTPGLPVHHQLPESTQTHVHWVSDAIQPSHPLSSPFPHALNLSQHQGLFKWVSSSNQVLEFQLQHQSFQWNTQDSSPLGWTGWISLQSKGLSRVFSNITVQKHQFFGAQLSL